MSLLLEEEEIDEWVFLSFVITFSTFKFHLHESVSSLWFNLQKRAWLCAKFCEIINNFRCVKSNITIIVNDRLFIITVLIIYMIMFPIKLERHNYEIVIEATSVQLRSMWFENRIFFENIIYDVNNDTIY